MRKRLVVIIFLASLLLFNGVFLQEAHADENNKLENIQLDRKAVQQDISNKEKELNRLLQSMQEISEEVSQLGREVEEKQTELDMITNNVDETLQDIETLQEEIVLLEESIEQRFEILKTRAASYQKSGGSINYLEVLFGAQSFADFISRLGAVTQIVDADASLIDDLNEDIETVEQHREVTLEKLNELNEMHAEQKSLVETLENEEKKLQGAQADLEKQEKSVVSYVEELKGEDAELASMESQVKEEIALVEKKQREAAEEQRKLQAAKEAEKQEKLEKEETKQKEKQTVTQKAEPETKSSNNTQVSKPKTKTASATVESPKQKDSTKTETSSKKTFTVSATAYTANCNGCSGITSTGINLKTNPGAKVIAVDPSVIPLGSTVYVEGYGYATAGDIGGAIKGKKIDVFIPNESQARAWGRKNVQVTIQ